MGEVFSVVRALIFCLLLAGCGNPLGLLTGGGTNVAANVQAGAQNTQAAVANSTDRRVVRPQARDFDNSQSEIRGEIVVVHRGLDPVWWAILIVVGFVLWELPAPRDIGRWIGGWFSDNNRSS